MTCKILDENFLNLDLLANFTVGSENASFPKENALSTQRRSKVYRSQGHWEVTAANNEIVFQETAAVDLTATITTGDYSSDTAFFAAIKAALELAGASSYTITRDSTTNKIKITSDGLGGGGILSLIWTDVASAGFAAIAGFNTAVDDTGALFYLADELRIHTSEWMKFDFGIVTNPDAFVLVGPRNQPIKISPSAVIKLQANETDTWTSPSYEVSLTYNENVISIMKDEALDGLHTDALRWWRIYIEDVDNPLGYVEIGAIFLGDFFEASQGAIQFPLQSQYIDRSTTVFSEGGQTFSDQREKSEQFTFEYRFLNVADREDLDVIFNNFGTSIPFFVNLDPDLYYSSSTEQFIRFVKFDSPPRWTLERPRLFSMSMILREEL